MKHKQTLSILLSLLMVLGLFSGCSDAPGDHSSSDALISSAVVDESDASKPDNDAPVRPTGMVSIDDPAVLQPDGSILTEELIKKASENPVVTSEDHPRWTGFTLGYFDDLGDPGTTPRTVELCGEWGFNSARVMLPYTTLFDQEVTTANLDMFYRLDEMVAAAIEQDIHLNIVFKSVPGRTVREGDNTNDYVSIGEFDLFLNEEKQKLALDVYRIIAARYKDVPNFNFSISPFWETMNKDLSTGLPYEDYTSDHVAEFLGETIDVIRAEAPDRLIIYEPTATNHELSIIEESTPIKAVADSKGNTIISYNFCQGAYVYAAMTATEGAHIDNMNSSMYLPSYPSTIYSVATHISGGSPLTLNGLLPAGTVIDFYLECSFEGSTLDISADGDSLYREDLAEVEYAISKRLSGYYPYATSEKKISVTLTQDAEEVVVSCLTESGFNLCGIYLTLPQEHAVDRWYYAQPYDVYMGREEEVGVVLQHSAEIMIAPNDWDIGKNITIQDDLTYSSEHIFDEASPDTIAAWSDAIGEFDGNCIIRFERADFSGCIWSEMKAYYEDLLMSFEEHGYSWWSNDWWLMTDEYPQTKIIAECPSTQYAGYPYFNLEMLELFQKYQSKE